jgi:diguanylate cyclase (GGDEF)-like protein
MNRIAALFEMKYHSQVVLRALTSSFLLGVFTGIVIKYLWEGLFPGAVYPTVYEVQIVTFILTMFISSPVLYGMFFMSLRVSLKNQELFQLANLDPLTGIHNRRALAGRFAMLARKARRNSQIGVLLVIDVDRFKAINDKHGHEVGDHVLMHLAQCLRRLAGPESCFARLGGEEFAVASFGVTEATAFGFAENIRIAIENAPLMQNQSSVAFTVSIGYCLIGAEDTLNDVLRNADTALYTAKRTGRNRTVRFDANAASLVPDADDIIQVAEKRDASQLASSNRLSSPAISSKA